MSKWDEEGLDGYDWYEGQPKWPLRRIIGVAAVAISVFIYLFLFFRFFTFFTGGWGDSILLNAESAAVYPSDSVRVLKFKPDTTEDDDATVVLENVVALEATDCFQCTLQINKNSHAPGAEDPGYLIALHWNKEGEGSRFIPLAAYRIKDHFQYRDLICLFEDVPDADSATMTLLICSADTAFSKVSFSDAFFTATVGGKSVRPYVIYPKEKQFIAIED